MQCNFGIKNFVWNFNLFYSLFFAKDMDNSTRGYCPNLQTGTKSHNGSIHGLLYVCIFEDSIEYWIFIKLPSNRAVVSFHFSISRLVYNYCTTVQKSKNKSVNLGTGTAKSGGGGAELIGQELYKRLKNFLETYLIELLKVKLLWNC